MFDPWVLSVSNVYKQIIYMMVCRGDWPKIDHLTSYCHSVLILASQESIPFGCELCSVLNMPACLNGINYCSLGEIGVVHITHTISSSGKFLEYGPLCYVLYGPVHISITQSGAYYPHFV